MVKVKGSQKTIQDDDIKNKTTRLIVRLVRELAGKKKGIAMKKNVVTMLLALMLSSYPIGAVQAYELKIPAGTAITVYTEHEIDADDVKEGERIDFVVQDPVSVDGIVAIKSGTHVSGQIIKKRNNFIFGVPGEVQVGNFRLKDQSGKVTNLRGTIIDKGDSKYWCHISWIFCFGIISFFIKGNDGKIPAGTYQVVYTTGDSFVKTDEVPVNYKQNNNNNINNPVVTPAYQYNPAPSPIIINNKN